MRKVELVLGFKCNCRCVFCVVDSWTAARSMSTAEALRHLAQARREGASAVDFGGGEPTLRPDLPDLARAAVKLGYRSIGVKSNGLRLCYPEYVEALLKAGLREFTVPVWGHVPEVHDALARTEGAFEKLELGIKNVVDLGGEVEADVLLTRLSVPRLRELVEAFADLGVRRFQMWLYCLFGSGGSRPELLPAMTAAGRAVADTAGALRRRKLEITTTHIPPCLLRPRPSLYRNPASLGLRIITPGGSFAVEESPFEAGRKAAKCARCAKRALCAGLRPEYLERFSGREVRPF